MDLNDDVVYRCLRLGPLDQRHPGRSRSLVRHHDRLHLDTSLYQSSPARRLARNFFAWSGSTGSGIAT
jgi:hypothetical protein